MEFVAFMMLSIPFSTCMHLAWWPPKNKIEIAFENKSLFIQNKRGDGSLWDIRLLAYLMFINLQSLLVTLVTTENRTQKHKISNGKNRDEMTVYRSYWDELTAKIWSKNIIALKKRGWDDTLWELLGGAVCGLWLLHLWFVTLLVAGLVTWVL